MTSKEKVLKIAPQAKCYQVSISDSIKHWHVNIGGVCYGSQKREASAWREAHDILTDKQQY